MRMGRNTVSRRLVNIVRLGWSLVGLGTLAMLAALADANRASGGLALAQRAAPFRLEDTKLEVGDALSSGRTVAWSHGGERIAYFYGTAVWTVPVDHWSQREQAYGVADYFQPWSLHKTFLAWSPDDAMIGVNLRKDQTPNPAEWYIGQVDWQRHALSFLALEPGAGSDWSNDDRIAGYLGWDLAIYDIRSLKWDMLDVPERFASFGLRPSAWTSDNQLLLAGTTEVDAYKPAWAYTFFLANLDTGQWEGLPVQAFGTSAYPALPMPSPDGRWIAWIEDRYDFDPRTWRIMLYDRTRAQVIEAANSKNNGTLAWESLSWSPDSNRLAFSAMRVKGSDDSKRTMWILHLDQSP